MSARQGRGRRGLVGDHHVTMLKVMRNAKSVPLLRMGRCPAEVDVQHITSVEQQDSLAGRFRS